MLTQIKNKPSEKRDGGLAAAFIECHERIRYFTALAGKLAEKPALSPGEISDAAARVHRYFSVALPLHQQDEDVSLRPRLSAVAGEEVRISLTQMAEQHVAIDALVDKLLPRWRDIAEDPSQLGRYGPEMRRDCQALQALWEIHLALEEEHIFPAMDVALSTDARAAIRAEMKSRRE